MGVFWHLMYKRRNGNSLNKFQETALANHRRQRQSNNHSETLKWIGPSLIVAKRECASLNRACFFTAIDGEYGTKVTATKELWTQNDRAKFLDTPYIDFN